MRTARTIDKVCEKCAASYTCNAQAGRRKYCNICIPLARKEEHDRYVKTPKWRAKQERYTQSMKGVAVQRKARLKWITETEKGRESHLRNATKRRRRIGNILPYMEMRKRVPGSCCAWCGRPGKEVDHIFPLRLGQILGLSMVDDYSNLQVLCYPCHDRKSVQDRRVIRDYLRGAEVYRRRRDGIDLPAADFLSYPQGR